MDARKHIKDLRPLFRLNILELSFLSIEPIDVRQDEGNEMTEAMKAPKFNINARFKSNLRIVLDYLNQKNHSFEPFIENLE
jgi:hypothetical protein